MFKQQCCHDKLLLIFCHSQASLGAHFIFQTLDGHMAGQGSDSTLGQGCHGIVLSYLGVSVTEVILKTVSTDKNHRGLTEVCLVMDLPTDLVCCTA